MKPRLSIMTAAAFMPLLLSAAPAASDRPEINLEHYLEYELDGKIDFSCKAEKTFFVCDSRDQRVVETDENNVSSLLAFEKAELRFNSAVQMQLQKERFEKTMRQIESVEKERKSFSDGRDDPGLTPPESPLQDELDRTLFGNLSRLSLDGLEIENSAPKTRIAVEHVSYGNSMKKTANGVAFSERIFGEIRLEYTHALVDTNDSAEYYRLLPQMLEERLGTHDEKRAEYVGNRLQTLAAEKLKSPVSGSFSLKTAYRGNDALSIVLAASNRNASGETDTFDFSGELRNASTIFKPARRPLTPGTPDFLFESLHSHSSGDVAAYRALLRSDRTFAKYIAEYDSLIGNYFDRKIARFKHSAVLVGWFTQAKNALSDLLTGKAGELDIRIRNKSGVTAMQLFGMLMGQMMAMPPQSGANAAPDQEKIIAETAAQNLEVQIEAK